MAGFRKKHSCQDVPLRFVQKCQWSIANNYVYGSILTDLSKALSTRLFFLGNLNAYGLQERARMFIVNFFGEIL